MTLAEILENGGSPRDLDNRNEDPKDVTDEHYHAEYNTISCPHCGSTLSAFTVMSNHYCYVCGGRFAKRELTADSEDELWEDEE